MLVAFGGLIWTISALVVAISGDLSAGPFVGLLVGESAVIVGLWRLRGWSSPRVRPPPAIAAGLATLSVGVIWPTMPAIVGVLVVWVAAPIAIVIGPTALSVWALVLQRTRPPSPAALLATGMLLSSSASFVLSDLWAGLSLAFGMFTVLFGLAMSRVSALG